MLVYSCTFSFLKQRNGKRIKLNYVVSCVVCDSALLRVQEMIVYSALNSHATNLSDYFIWTVCRTGQEAGIACWLECRNQDLKVASSNPGRSGGKISLSRVNFVCWLLFGVRSTPLLQQWHVKDPGHSAKSAGGRLHRNTYTPLTWRSRCGLTMSLSRHSVGTNPETSSHATCRGTFSHSRLRSLSHCGLVVVYKQWN